MQTPIEVAMTFLLNAVWQVPLIALAAAVCVRLLSGVSPRYTYWFWVTALVLSLLVPVVTSVSSSRGEVFQAAGTPVLSGEKLSAETYELSAVESVSRESAPGTFFTLPIALAIAIFAVYALFVLYRSADLLRAWLKTRAVVRDARRAELPECIVSALEKCSAVVGKREIEVLFSDRVPVPVTIGNRRPAVILPEHFLQETEPDVLITALGHEMVHVERRDYAFNLLFEITCLPLSFHPAAAYAKRRVAHMRELCCDEIVATRLLKAEAYARSLLNIAGSASSLNRLSPIITVGITDAENLEVRIMSLLKRSEMSFRKKAFLVTAAVMLLTIPLVAAAFISPAVSVNSVSEQPEAQPTVPERVGSEQIEGVERKLEWLRAALQDPKLNDVDRAKIKHDIETLERELAERKLQETDRGVGRERLERQLVEVKTALADPNLPQEKRAIFAEMESKLERELQESEEIGYSEEVTGEKRARVNDEERQEKEKLGKMAKISGDQAIEIALAANPGKIIEKGIGRINDEVVYKFLIRVEPETPERNAVFVVVSGVDGRIVNTENVFVKEMRKGDTVRRNLILKKNPNDN